jgi:hypothetical protein
MKKKHFAVVMKIFFSANTEMLRHRALDPKVRDLKVLTLKFKVQSSLVPKNI